MTSPHQSIQPPLNIAHRGASGYAPENTFAAFDLALALGADMLELDVRLTADRHLVVLHDLALGRHADGAAWDYSRHPSSMFLNDVKRVDIGSWFNDCHPNLARPEYVGLRPPTLDGFFDRYRDATRFLLDLKEPELSSVMEVEILRTLDRYSVANDSVIVASGNVPCLRRLRSMDPSLTLARIAAGGESQPLSGEVERIANYASALVVPKEIVHEGLVRSCHRSFVSVLPYTVNRVEDARGLVSMGVDALITDVPDRIGELFGTRSSRRPQLV